MMLFFVLVALSLTLGVWGDEHNIVIPLAFEPDSQLMTATLAVGSPANTYDLVLDTGSPLVVVQDSVFHKTASTSDAAQPEMGDMQGYVTTTPAGGDGAPVKPTMHFITDLAYLVQGSGVEAGGGALAGNMTLALAGLPLKAQGILGLSPPFNKVQAKPGKDGEKTKIPSADVSFLGSYLSDDGRKRLGITGASHFYTAMAPPTDSTPASGQLVFPKEGTTVPTVEGYDAGAAITIDPNSGSTFPGHPFWGIAHRHDLRFVIDDHVLDSVRIDALLLDTGTAGVVGPPSEVAKIIDATQGRLKRTSSDPKQVVADAACDLPIQLGFEIGGKRTTFTAIRKPSPAAPQYIRMAVDGQGSENVQAVQAIKSYQTAGVNVHLQQMRNSVDALTGLIGSPSASRLRRMQKRNPLLQNAHLADSADSGQRCSLSLTGNPQVDQMFPQNGPDFKVWILGTEFFQQNLVYHNIDSAVTTIIPRK
jgi:hypothetical protein